MAVKLSEVSIEKEMKRSYLEISWLPSYLKSALKRR